MKSLLYIGGPLILFTGLAFWTDLFTLPSEEPGPVHFTGVPFAGLLQLNTKVYQCDEAGGNCVLVEETNEFTEVEGLELEPEAIEYREGSNQQYSKTKQPGLTKYTNIQFNNLGDYTFDAEAWRLMIEHKIVVEEIDREYEEKRRELEEARSTVIERAGE